MGNSKAKKAKKTKIIKKILLYFVLICFGLLQVFPFIWLFDFSLAKDNELFSTDILVFSEHPQWSNYATAWTQGHIAKFTLNSVMIVALTAFITIVLSLSLGYAFTRMKWKHSAQVMSFMLLGMLIPIHTTLLPNFLIFRKLAILDTPLALLIPYAAFSVPFGVFIMTGFMKSIPRALEEAAVMDGAGIFRIIFRIVAPITKPAIATIIVLTFINNWNEFIVAATYLSSNTWKTLPFSVYEFSGQYSSQYAVQFAVMTLATLPALVTYIVLNEQITKGITVGAVKG